MKQVFQLLILALIAGLGVRQSAVAQQGAAPNGIPVHMIVTVEPKHGANAPVINREDVMVYEGRDRDTVTDWVPLQGDRADVVAHSRVAISSKQIRDRAAFASLPIRKFKRH